METIFTIPSNYMRNFFSHRDFYCQEYPDKIPIPDVDSNLDTFLESTATVNAVTHNIMLGMKLLAGIFLIIWVIRKVKEVVLEEKPLDKTDILKTVGILLILIMYVPLYDGVKGLFDSVFDYINELNKDQANLKSMLAEVKAETSESGGILSMMSTTVTEFMTNGMVKMIEWIDDGVNWGFEIYVNVCLMIVKLTGPVAIVFTLFLKDVFMKWFMMFLKYTFYGFILAIAIGLGSGFLLNFFTGVSSGVFENIAKVKLSIDASVWIGIMISYLLFKIIFTIVGFNVIDALFQSGNTGVGGMVGGLANAGRKVAQGAMGAPPV